MAGFNDTVGSVVTAIVGLFVDGRTGVAYQQVWDGTSNQSVSPLWVSTLVSAQFAFGLQSNFFETPNGTVFVVGSNGMAILAEFLPLKSAQPQPTDAPVLFKVVHSFNLTFSSELIGYHDGVILIGGPNNDDSATQFQMVNVSTLEMSAVFSVDAFVGDDFQPLTTFW